MDTVTIAHAKEHLEELIERAARGEEVRIAGTQGTAVRLTPLPAEATSTGPYPPRLPGLLRDKVRMSDAELFAPLTDEELAWLAGETSP